MATGLDLDEDLSRNLGLVDVLGGDLDLEEDSSLGVSEDRSLNQEVVGLGLGLEVNEVQQSFGLAGESWPLVLIFLKT